MLCIQKKLTAKNPPSLFLPSLPLARLRAKTFKAKNQKTHSSSSHPPILFCKKKASAPWFLLPQSPLRALPLVSSLPLHDSASAHEGLVCGPVPPGNQGKASISSSCVARDDAADLIQCSASHWVLVVLSRHSIYKSASFFAFPSGL